MPKTNNHTSKAKNKTKQQTQQDKLGSYIFMNSWQEKGATKSFIERLAGRMLEYFSDKNKLTLEEFFDDESISESSYYGWVEKWPELQEVHEFTVMRLGGRREKGMLLGSVKEKSGMHVQHQFSKRWKEADAYWSEMRKKEQTHYVTDHVPYLEVIRCDDGRLVERRMLEGKEVKDEVPETDE